MKYVLVSLFLMNSFLSCTLVKDAFIGTASPRMETRESVSLFLRKERISAEYIYSVAPDSFYSALNYLGFGVIVFDKSGNYLAFGNNKGKYCFSTLADSLRHLYPDNRYSNEVANYSLLKRMTYIHMDSTPVVSYDTISLDIPSVSSNFYDFEGRKTALRIGDGVDYIIVFPFAKYYGRKIQTKEIRRYIRAANQNEHSKFQFVFLNLDKQQWWGKEWNEKIKLNTE